MNNTMNINLQLLIFGILIFSFNCTPNKSDNGTDKNKAVTVLAQMDTINPNDDTLYGHRLSSDGATGWYFYSGKNPSSINDACSEDQINHVSVAYDVDKISHCDPQPDPNDNDKWLELIRLTKKTKAKSFSEVPISIEIEDVFAVKQPTSMSCWAAAYTMLFSWKAKSSYTIESALRQVDEKYLTLFNDDRGIEADIEAEFYTDANMKVIPQFNPSIQGWYELLKDHGPLSITVDSSPPQLTYHALVIIGLEGDGNPSRTIVKYIDPGDGNKHELIFSDFINLYEGSSTWPNQIIHW
jgi:hypothetical protein